MSTLGRVLLRNLLSSDLESTTVVRYVPTHVSSVSSSIAQSGIAIIVNLPVSNQFPFPFILTMPLILT